jgi:hypothetical protein
MNKIEVCPKVFQGLSDGLSICRYIGGDGFRCAKEILHLNILKNESNESNECNDNIFLNKDLIINSINSYLLNHDNSVTTLPNKIDNWDKCTWDCKFLISTNVPSCNECNLYFHGWLHKDYAINNCYGNIIYPLIGIFDKYDGLINNNNNSQIVNELNYIPFNSFDFADQHIHKVDLFAGGSRDDYIELLISNGLNIEDAEIFVQIEENSSNDYYLGSDMAKIGFNCDNICDTFVVCIDLSDPNNPKILVTLLILIFNQEIINNLMEIINNIDNINEKFNHLKDIFSIFNSIPSLSKEFDIRRQQQVSKIFSNFSC